MTFSHKETGHMEGDAGRETRLGFDHWCQHITTEEIPPGQREHEQADLARRYLDGTATEEETFALKQRWLRAQESSYSGPRYY